jgi:hypothetical protein
MLPDSDLRNSERKESTMRTCRVLLIAGVMMLGSACATAPPSPPPSVDVSGTWAGTWSAFEGSGGAGQIRGIFRQDGATLYGNFEINNPAVDPPVNRTYVSGTVIANQVRLLAPSEGLLVVDGDEMNGEVRGIVAARVKLRRQP